MPIHVESGWVKTLDYDPTTRALQVETKRGDIYEYAGVSPTAYNDLAAAESLGHHLNAHIKPNHRARKLR